MAVIQLLSHVQLLGPHGLQPPRLLSPWDSPGENTGAGSHSLLQGIFLTQGSNPGLQHCRWTLCRLTTGEASNVLKLDCGDDCCVNVLKPLWGEEACGFTLVALLIICAALPRHDYGEVHVTTKEASRDAPEGAAEEAGPSVTGEPAADGRPCWCPGSKANLKRD